jgi:hypothetical protein
MFGTALGGAALGMVEKYFPNLPTIPLVGKVGSIAIAAYFLRNSLPIARDVAIAASAVAGYQLGNEGRIHGDDMSQFGDVHGIASQV